MPRTRLDQATLTRLIGSVYAAVEDARLWEPLLLSLSRAVGAAGTALISHDLVASGSVLVQAGIDPEALYLYNAHYHRVDVWAATGQRLLTNAKPTQVFLDQAMVSRHELQKTEYYPYARRYHVSRLMHSILERDSRGIAGISVLRGDTDPPFSDNEAAFLGALNPHLRRGLRIHSVFTRAAQSRDAALEGLDALTLGVLFVTGEGRVVGANKEAAAILARRDGLITSSGVLTAASSAMTSSLHRLCAACAATTNATGLSAGGSLSLPRPSGRRELRVVVSPVTRTRPLGLPHDVRAAAVVLVSDPEQKAVATPQLLQTLYGLTPAEGRVAALLAAGSPLAAIGDQCGYTRQTVQWYSKQILSKTGCRTRAALVRTLSTSLATLSQHDRSS